MSAKTANKTRRKARTETWNIYVYKVLKQVAPDCVRLHKVLELQSGVRE